MRTSTYLVSMAALLLLSGASRAGETDELPDSTGSRLHGEYGFSGMIISKLNDGITNLTAADLNGDGKGDLLVLNNPRSRIEFMFRSEEGPGGAPTPEFLNELPDEVYFQRDSYPIEEKMSSVAVADLNGDQAADLIFLGESGKVTVAYRGQDGKYQRSNRYEVEDHSGVWRAVRPADLNGDGRCDLVVLGREVTYLFEQNEEGRLEQPRKLPNGTKDAGSFEVEDLNQDGHQDLLYVHYDSDLPFRYRLGQGGFAFGPEIKSRFAAIRSYMVGDFDGKPGCELIAVRRNSSRVALLRFKSQVQEEQDELPLSSLRSVPFEKGKDGEQRAQVLVDLEGDGRPELLVAEPTAAQIVSHHSLLGGGPSSAVKFPSFVGARFPGVGDVDGDGKVELVVAAPDEGAVGVSAIEADGSIGFPMAVAIPNGDDLLAMDVVDTDGDGLFEIWLALGSGSSRSRERRVVQLGPTFEMQREVKLAKQKSDPNDLLLADLNRDGQTDIMLFQPREIPTIWLQQADGSFVDLDTSTVPTLGILEGTSLDSLAWGDIDGDGQKELLVPGPNFARAFYLDGENQPQVVAQFNLDRSAAQVAKVALGDLDGKGDPEIVLFDKAGSTLTVLSRSKGASREIARVDLGGVEPESLLVTDLDMDGRNDLLLFCNDRFAVIRNGGADPVFDPVDELEIPVRDVVLDDLGVGDLNNDGEMDLVLLESSRHLVTISAIHPDKLEYALRFPVYEERIFERGGRGGREPREVVLSDVTGDGRPDITILVHDRMIVYPQE
ncbi:MAG: VCBS repeat-containing protein [Planctomycetota bacterium]